MRNHDSPGADSRHKSVKIEPGQHLDDEFAGLRARITNAFDADVQRDCLELVVRSLRSESLFGAQGVEIVPIELDQAQSFIARHHRHSKPPYRWKYGCAARDRLGLVGVVVVERPKARGNCDGRSLEVSRLCTLARAKNVSSMLLGRACRVARELGYTRMVSYTLEDEDGDCYRAAGFEPVAKVKGRPWDCPSRRRKRQAEDEPDKIRWERVL